MRVFCKAPFKHLSLTRRFSRTLLSEAFHSRLCHATFKASAPPARNSTLLAPARCFACARVRVRVRACALVRAPFRARACSLTCVRSRACCVVSLHVPTHRRTRGPAKPDSRGAVAQALTKAGRPLSGRGGRGPGASPAPRLPEPGTPLAHEHALFCANNLTARSTATRATTTSTATTPTPFTTLCRERQVISRIALLREHQGGCGREHLLRAVLHHHGPLHPPEAVCQHQLAVLHLLEAVFLLQ